MSLFADDCAGQVRSVPAGVEHAHVQESEDEDQRHVLLADGPEVAERSDSAPQGTHQEHLLAAELVGPRPQFAPLAGKLQGGKPVAEKKEEKPEKETTKKAADEKEASK